MKRTKGYILLARQLLESGIMEGPPLHLKLFVWMLLRANWADNPKTGINRGQLFTTIKEMRNAMSYKIGYRKISPTRDEIRWIYRQLTNTRMTTTTKTTRGMIITILNYDKYQLKENYENHNEHHPQPHTILEEVILTNNKDIYSRVISHLNQKTGKTFRPSTAKTQKHINARLNEGFTPEDLIAVIDIKSKQWIGDEKMEGYLRPETLFGTKFESYLNERKKAAVKPKLTTAEDIRRAMDE